jgi:hypothetical protein
MDSKAYQLLSTLPPSGMASIKDPNVMNWLRQMQAAGFLVETPPPAPGYIGWQLTPAGQAAKVLLPP